MDYLGNRFALKHLTEENFPATGKDDTNEIDPYLYINEYNIPIRDTYDPNVRIDTETWLGWSSSYRILPHKPCSPGTFHAQKRSKRGPDSHSDS